MTPPRRLLIRGVNWLGDAVMTTPALLRLHERFPHTHIALLSPAKLAGLWPAHPAIHETLDFAPRESVLSVARRLRRQAFDTALILPNSPRAAFECWLARIPVRVGYPRRFRSWSLTQVVPDRSDRVPMTKPTRSEIQQRLQHPPPLAERRPPPRAHHLHDYLHLAAALGANPEPLPPRLAVTEAETAEVRARFQLHPDTPWIALNPGAEYGPAKRWPATHFTQVAHQIHRLHPRVRWIILGGPNDVPIAEVIHRSVPHSVLLAGRTSLRQLMAVLGLCEVVLTNDTGPMHVAAAMGTRVVVPFGSTSPELTGPGLPGDPRHRLVRADTPCAPCFLRECPIDFRCMNGISPEMVGQAVLEALAPRLPTE
ncbi:MAG: lipopolysaccharide heptosyltransferase II [Verrucomicrobiales bacterium]|nr:lipopolysaccharide heptosyltransferase II [Verrucomicrobiales bacterium]